jgi:hypothetical protein
MWTSWVSKDAEFYVGRFQQFKLTFVTKCTKKKIFQDKEFRQQGPPV